MATMSRKDPNGWVRIGGRHLPPGGLVHGGAHPVDCQSKPCQLFRCPTHPKAPTKTQDEYPNSLGVCPLEETHSHTGHTGSENLVYDAAVMRPTIGPGTRLPATESALPTSWTTISNRSVPLMPISSVVQYT